MEPSSKRRKEAPLKLNQLQSNEQQPVMAVTPTVRAVQPPQAHVQRLGAATGLMSLTNRQQQLQSQLQQKQQQLRQKQQEIGQKQQQIQRQQQQIQQQQLQLQQQEQQIQQLQREIMRQRDQIQLQQEQVTVPVPVAQPSRQIQASAESNIEDSESIAYLQKEIHFPHRAIVQRQVTGDEVKMLVIAGNGTQSLITFAVPIEDCTVGQLIEQVTVIFHFSKQWRLPNSLHRYMEKMPALGKGMQN